MTKEADMHAAVDDLLAANHKVAVDITDTKIDVRGVLNDSAVVADNVHSIRVQTKSEALIEAIVQAIDTTGLP